MRLTDWKIFVILNLIFWAYLWHDSSVKKEATNQWGAQLCEKVSVTQNPPADLVAVCKNMKNDN